MSWGNVDRDDMDPLLNKTAQERCELLMKDPGLWHWFDDQVEKTEIDKFSTICVRKNLNQILDGEPKSILRKCGGVNQDVRVKDKKKVRFDENAKNGDGNFHMWTSGRFRLNCRFNCRCFYCEIRSDDDKYKLETEELYIVGEDKN